MARALALGVEVLEARDVPVTFGNPWPDGAHLTLSIAPDGTPINDATSNLAALLKSYGPAAEMDILVAFQTWAVQTNVNFGLVTDNGAAFGTGGDVHGDPRFGDIRVGGIPIAPDVLAITSPYMPYNDFSGDVVVNTTTPFGQSGYDLYTVLLHEAGHALGLGDNSDPTSVMYQSYNGYRTGLSGPDITAIQSLYGTRPAAGSNSNETLATATPYPLNGDPVTGNLNSPTDVDFYKFTAGLLTNNVTVNLDSEGQSLLTANVELLDSSGRLVTSAATTDPTQNNVTLSLGSVQAGQTYYVRVSAARSDEFGVGSYTLDVKQSSILTPILGTVGNLLTATGLNNTLATATKLVSNTLSGPQTEFTTQGTFVFPNQANWYSIAVPSSNSNAPENALVTVWGQSGSVLNPWIEVTDALGHELPAEVLTANGNSTTIQVIGLTAGETYYIKTFSDTQATGGYTLSADVSTNLQTIPELASGTLSAAAPAQTTTFTLDQTAQIHLVLTATGASGIIEAVVTNAAGQVVGLFDANADRGRSVDVILPVGTYTVSVQLVRGSTLGFQLNLAIITEPVSTQAEDPTTTPAPTDPSPTVPTSGPAPTPSEPSQGNPPPPQPTDQTSDGSDSQSNSDDSAEW